MLYNRTKQYCDSKYPHNLDTGFCNGDIRCHNDEQYECRLQICYTFGPRYEPCAESVPLTKKILIHQFGDIGQLIILFLFGYDNKQNEFTNDCEMAEIDIFFTHNEFLHVSVSH